jgi:indole-3-glycerol phosphate synthase/phosphoribosylanthranilate isomerase
VALEAILAHKRAELAVRRAARPWSDLTEGVGSSDRDFEGALRRSGPAFILEIKPASPSEGRLRDPADLAPAIECYGRHADVISVLTDQRYFGGSFELLSEVRRSVSQPILCKDFVLDPYQVYEARRAGADAVLLMLSVLDDAQYRACATAAAGLGMGVLTEIHSTAEMARAAALGARVIGVNNRDLRTLTVDLDTTPTLAQLAPGSALVIAESGIRSRADVRRLASEVDGFLIGTALMRSPEVDRAARRLIYGETKVCGLTRPPDAAAAERVGATHGGLIFARESPRWVAPEAAREIRAAAGLDWVGVFVNEAVTAISRTVTALGLDAVQLHGDEGPDQVAALRRLIPGECQIWKAVPVRDRIDPEPDGCGADRVLLDRFDPTRRGGSGAKFDWSGLADLRAPDRVVLSGGLTPENLPDAAALPIDAFDVNSGVETEPGHKSAEKLTRFFKARRAHHRCRTTVP